MMVAVENRVAGTPKAFPSQPVSARESTTFDLVSVPVEGADVVYAAEGTPTLPPLIFLHGWGASHKFWKYVFPAFSKRFRCIAPDLMGFGLSDKPNRDYSMDSYTTWVGSFLDALKIDKAPIVGHSMGGTIALKFALAHPERVTRLVAVNPVLKGSTAFSALTRTICLPGIRRICWILSRIVWFRRLVTGDFSKVQQMEEELMDDVIMGTFQSTFKSVSSLFRVDLLDQIGDLSIPTLAIGSDLDRVVAAGQHEFIKATRTETIEACGHIPMVEKPMSFNRILDSFLTVGPEVALTPAH